MTSVLSMDLYPAPKLPLQGAPVFLALLSKPFVKSEKEWAWEVRASCGLRTAGTLGWLVCPLGKDRIFLKNFTGISEAVLVS